MLEWWTDRLYETAYSKLEHKYPVVIPSYNRPNPISIEKLFSNMTDDCNWPVYIFVRLSQLDMYSHLENKYINVIGLPDNMISNIGDTRNQIIKQYGITYYSPRIFMMDDDITSIGYLSRGSDKKMNPVSFQVKDANPIKVLAMWQYMMELACNKFDIVMSCTTNPGYSWPAENTDINYSIKLMSGRYAGLVCIDIDKLNKNNIGYRSSYISGHEDTDILIRSLLKNLLVCQMSSIYYTTVDMSYKEWGYDSVYSRLVEQNNILKDQYDDIYWLKFEDKYKEKGKLPTITVNWRGIRSRIGLKDYKINLWREV